ncbi:sphingomyelin phosphodiesterase-like [Branchiostoma floridae]|uniref:Sphingomyelin phosphodiesterase n=1 Tax=Branchiostoma floridae TaxID=7739 RepID=A0A9J7LSR8_BRAFL|nr:sphingomyelin phosphodiesterase-like [Branchiostoma floridae]
MAYVLFSAGSALFCAFLLLVASPPTSHSDVRNDMEKLDALGRTIQEARLSDPELEGSLKCSLCEMGMEVVQGLFIQNKSQDEIATVVTKLCILFHVEDKTVCTYIVQLFKHEILTVIDKLALSPKEACGLIVHDCGSPYDPTSFWNITLPNTPKPPVTPPKPPKPGAPVSRVLFLSDVHVDLLYKPGANVDCGEPLCCRANSPAGKGGPKPAGKWGDYRYCDTPLWTMENLLQHLAQKQSQFDYAIWAGDIPAHDVWNQSRTDQLHVLNTVSDMMLKYLKIPIYPALGNHESSPVDSFPPPFITGKDSISWLYDALAETWTHWTPVSTKRNIERGAFYSILIRPGLRLISINTNYCNTNNWWLLLNTTDPAGQLQWLTQQLQQAEDKGEKVHIIGHIPPGTNCLKAWSWNYYRIIDRYESTVAAQFFGHTHRDHFELFYDMKNRTRPTNIAYIGPSVTTYQYLNPGYKVYEIDGNYTGSSMLVVNQQTYIMNLTEANLTDKPNWQLEYDTKEAYNMSSMTPADWDKFVQRLEKDDKLFQTFYRYYYKSYPAEACDQKCRTALICDLKTARSDDPSMCTLTPEVTWRDLQNYRTANRLC